MDKLYLVSHFRTVSPITYFERVVFFAVRLLCGNYRLAKKFLQREIALIRNKLAYVCVYVLVKVPNESDFYGEPNLYHT